MIVLRRLLHLAILTLALLTVLASLASKGCRTAAAPAPLPRRTSRLDLAGCSQLHWDACTFSVTFSPDGRYSAVGRTGVWRGRWRLVGRTLTVWESQGGQRYSTWSATLDRSLAGRASGDYHVVAVRLSR